MESCQSTGPAEVLWVELERVGPAELDQFPDLRIVATPCTGTDHIDVAECVRRGIEVLSITGWPGLRDVRGTAELTIALMLLALRGWYPTREKAPGRTLHGKRVAIIGMGRIGQQVAELVRGFGAEVVPEDPTDVDIVSLHLRLTPATYRSIGRRQFQRWRHGTILVNTARGDLVVPADVVQALNTGKLAWYAADFLNGTVHPRMTLTPHVGGWTVEGIDLTQDYLAKQVVACLDRQDGCRDTGSDG